MELNLDSEGLILIQKYMCVFKSTIITHESLLAKIQMKISIVSTNGSLDNFTES